ncbi:uncharacterized protein UMAG_03332 [Mycosarcoma maydis]|uniref:J domain-containing protein n=1 Tax=Mycosarcoma maydis TaxID=5270 RepID=A0A0D1DYP8_MYCMD|nr:uncharacterized protein UMAG_03332 [Ustilago maydis 521]KIS68766.1 hypothetical protein UMAG_03332 [Ustilago maydis 521]|eukprot:XP_011389728.1 hypothetical protein UMAG_03332 [Ustilago maydis 521]
MSSKIDDMDDAFRVLSLPITATEAEIKKAYRKLSLRYHPDKAGKDVDPVKAAARFHEINLAYETLMDPAARARAVQRNAQEAAKQERQEQYQGRRRQMADELERNEQQATQKRQDADKQARERIAKIAKLQAESRELIKRKQLEMEDIANQTQQALADKKRKEEERLKAAREPELHPLDKTVRIQFPSSQLAQLTGIADATKAPEDPLTTPLARTLSNQFGELDHLQFQLPSPGKKLKRELMALATFKELPSAWQAVVTGGEMRCTGLLEECFIGWAQYSRNSKTKDKIYVEPKRVVWYREHGILQPRDIGRIRPTVMQVEDTSTEQRPTESPSSSSVYSKAYEARTLQRLRDAIQQPSLAQAQAAQ